MSSLLCLMVMFSTVFGSTMMTVNAEEDAPEEDMQTKEIPASDSSGSEEKRSETVQQDVSSSGSKEEKDSSSHAVFLRH